MGNVSITYSTLYWISGVLLTTAVIFVGAAKVVCSRYDPKQFWHLIEKYKVRNSSYTIKKTNCLRHLNPIFLADNQHDHRSVAGGRYNQIRSTRWSRHHQLHELHHRGRLLIQKIHNGTSRLATGNVRFHGLRTNGSGWSGHCLSAKAGETRFGTPLQAGICWQAHPRNEV